ncbi:MAG: HD domain-containing protein [Clostridia bacterium]|nr:HD domain-containing protein [Clostridia bacterium]MDH7572778.1 HD domain-containing protein [Clostridia bacterium]
MNGSTQTVVRLEDVKRDPEVAVYIARSNEYLGAIGYTEHGQRHVNLVAQVAYNILTHLGHPRRTAELAAIAGYLHDIGNVVGRHNHGQAGALIAYQILGRLGMPPEEVAQVVGAVGNHEEEYGQAVNPVAAALILADKSDVHRSRVRNRDPATFDLHDRVNYAVERSFLRVDAERKRLTMELTIDTDISPVMDYFEIFLTRMLMCRRAAAFLGCAFGMEINGARFL